MGADLTSSLRVIDAALVNETLGNQQTQKMSNIIIRNASAVATLLVIGEDNSVMFGGGDKPNADELAGFAVDRANASASASLQAVNAVRLARCLPDIVTGGVVGAKGAKSPVVKTPAMKYVLELVERGCKTPSTYQNIAGLIECADIAANSGVTASPFAIKEGLGYLRKVGAIQSTDSGPKLLMSKGGAVAKALKAGTGVNAMRPVISKAKAAKPTLFPVKATGSTSKAPAAPVKADDSADKLATDLKIIVGRWDKLAGGKDGSAKLRAACGETVANLAKLAGFSTAPLK